MVSEKLKFFIKIINGDKEEIKDMFVYIEESSTTQDKFLYFSDKNNVLYKINANNGQEIWKYEVGNEIKSIAINTEKHIFIQTTDGILEIDSNKNDIAVKNIRCNKMIIDNNTVYIANSNKVSKLDNNYKEIASYSVSGDVTNLASDNKGNIYIGTNSEITKVKNDFRVNEKSRNLLPPFNGDNWMNCFSAISPDGKTLNFLKNQTGYWIKCSNYINFSVNCNLVLSWKYVKGDTISISANFFDSNSNNIQSPLNNDTIVKSNSIIINPPKNACFIQLFFNKLDYIITNVQLEEGDKATPYAPKGEYVQSYEWKYSINSNSIALDSENNFYISTSKDIQKFNSNGQKIDTLDIQADKIALDLEDNMYISKDTTVEKLTKKMIGDKDSRNLLRNGNFESSNLVDFGSANNCMKSIVNDVSYQGNYSLQVTFNNIQTYDSGLSIAYPNAIENKTYTISGYINSSKNTSLRVRPLYKNWDTLGDEIINIKANKWSYFSHTFTTRDTRNMILILLGNDVNIKGYNGMNLYFDNIQLEEGDKATPWKPNLNDYIRQGEWKYIDNSKINNICIG